MAPSLEPRTNRFEMRPLALLLYTLCITLAGGCMFSAGPEAMSKQASAALEAPPGTILRTAINLALSMDKRELIFCPPAPVTGNWLAPSRDGSAHMASVGRLVSTGTLLRVESVYKNTDPFAGGFIAYVTVLTGPHTGLISVMNTIRSVNLVDAGAKDV